MKAIKFFLTILFLAPVISYSQGEFLIRLDTATGQFTHIGGPINGIQWVFPYIRGYNENQGVYIFQGGMSIVDHLYSIDVSNGSILSNPYYPQTNPRELKYDNSNDSLYGLDWNSSLSQFSISSVNPSTGLTTGTGNSIPGLSSTSQGATAYDGSHHRYFTLQNNQLFSINAVSGNLISSPSLIFAAGDQLIHFCYNSTLDTLNGLVQNSNTQLCYVVSINTISGAVTKIGPGSPHGMGGGSSSIDETNQRYIFTYQVSGLWYIASMDIATGSLVSNKLIPMVSGSNIHSISFDNVRGKLFGIQWDASTRSNGILSYADVHKIYPIPSNSTLTIESTTEMGTIIIFNSLGNAVIHSESNTTKTTIDISNLTPGFYNLEVQKRHYKIIKD